MTSEASIDSGASPSDDELEQMLAQAGRLALEMRTLTGGSQSLPESIEMKDGHSTESSSVEAKTLPANPKLATTTGLFSDMREETKSIDSVDELLNNVGVTKETGVMLQPSTASDEKSAQSEASSSSAAEQQRTEVTAVVKASQEMARQLQDIQPKPPTTPPPLNNNNNNEPRVVETKLPDTPESRETMASSPLPVSPDVNAWEKVVAQDDDYVSIADYTKRITPTKQQQKVDHHHNNIKWEKVTLAQKEDDDYVPIADYSRDYRPISLDFQPDPLYRRSARRRKRKQRRRAAAVFLVVLVVVVVAAVLWWKWSDLQLAAREVLPPTPQEIAAVEAARLEALHDEAAQQRAAFARALAAHRAALARAAREEAARVAAIAAEQAVKKEARQKLCRVPFAGMLSPVCEQTGHIGREERGIIVFELVQAMMQ